MEKTFTRAGISNLNGKVQFRFTNDLNRETVLVKNGHTDVVFYELGSAMTKAAATEFLVAKGLEETVVKAAPKAPKPAKVKPDTAARAKDEAILAKLDAGELEYDETSDSFKRLVAEKRQLFPSHTEEQLAELVAFQARANMKEFGDLEPTF